jgi:putative ABC transport system substrate-binding protein
VTRLGLVLLLLTSAAPARAGVAILVDPKVPQYVEALEGAKEGLKSDYLVVDVSAPNAGERLRAADPTLILAIGQKALKTADDLNLGRPVVFSTVLGSSTSRTVTGVRLEVSIALQLGELQKVAPGLKRVGIFYSPRTAGAAMEEAARAARGLGLSLVPRPVEDGKQLRDVLDDVLAAVDALLLVQDPRLINAEMFNYLLVRTLERKVPLFGFLDSFTQAGALASVSPDYRENGRRAARLALEILAKPPETRLPVPPPVGGPGALTVNLKTAKRLGVEVPAGALDRARKVFR